MMIRYLASSSLASVLADTMGCCRSTVQLHLVDMINVMNNPNIVSQWINMPLNDRRWCQETAENFEAYGLLGSE